MDRISPKALELDARRGNDRVRRAAFVREYLMQSRGCIVTAAEAVAAYEAEKRAGRVR